MGGDTFAPRNGWPDWLVEPLERVGISRCDTVDTMRPKIAALGFEIVAMYEDPGGMPPTHPFYVAEVRDPRRADGVLGVYHSATDYAEALAWATARVIKDNEKRDAERPRLEEAGAP